MTRLDIDIDLNGLRTSGQRIASLMPAYRKKLLATMGRGAKRGMHDVLDEWKVEAVDLAPLDKGLLRRGIHTKVTGKSANLTATIQSSAVESSNGQRFDYAYYLHNVYPEKYGDSFQNPTTPGTIPNYLEKPAEENKERWKQMIEDEIKAEMSRAGYNIR
ncbi:HK97 gp10 family phage protein [Brevibacillus laterosporus]|uniref:HK97 gp10 family phage protein n=1 Tax=Brevibacillus laterosporus TaxID=1465 RepID=A0A518V9F8_BRELA|nr:HK97 gp10 family phage protein [Brevibacillus laterosporus]